MSAIDSITKLLGEETDSLLNHTCKGIMKDRLHLPGPDWIERIFLPSDRSIRVLRSLQMLFSNGRLAGTGYLSILPVDQGVEHSAGASFAPNPIYLDGENIVKLAIEGGCNAVASTLGVLGSDERMYTELCSDHPIDLTRYQAASDQAQRFHQAFRKFEQEVPPEVTKSGPPRK